jgi:hypothetical protein
MCDIHVTGCQLPVGLGANAPLRLSAENPPRTSGLFFTKPGSSSDTKSKVTTGA